MSDNETCSSTQLLEGMTSISALLASDAEINNRRIERIWIDRTKRRTKGAEIRFLQAKGQELCFPVEFVDPETLAKLTDGSSHGGIVAFCSERTLPALCAESITPGGLYVYLEGMEDPYNFGNALRSLYAAGVCGVVVPPRNWTSAAGVVARASAGASERLPLLTADADTLIAAFRKAGYRILCAGIRNSVSVYGQHFSYPLLLVIGGEKRGISRKILEQADCIVRIDYGRAFRGSLSASSSAAVLAFELMRQNRTEALSPRDP